VRSLKNVHFCSSSRKGKILTTPVRSAGPTGQAGIHGVFRGLKFEPDPREIGYAFHGAGVEIGQKVVFCKSLKAVNGTKA